jgi:hypothetical protein
MRGGAVNISAALLFLVSLWALRKFAIWQYINWTNPPFFAANRRRVRKWRRGSFIDFWDI